MRLIWMADQDESAEEEYGLISRLIGDRPFLLASVPVRDWFSDLYPWPAGPVFGKEAFGSGAGDTLAFLTQRLLPALEAIGRKAATFLGGYSLAGLFALWAGYESGAFAGVAGVSPSVWFPGWEDYTARRTPKARAVYLSLGDREERTRNPVMARVGDCIRRQRQALESQGVPSILEWNEGNHFREPETRMAKGFAWLMNQGS
ncbi:MAG: esterase [Clostridiales bacterium]|nr:esterase [Clostridiales bacterium]